MCVCVCVCVCVGGLSRVGIINKRYCICVWWCFFVLII